MKNVSRSISIALVVSMLASIGLVGVYIAGGDRTAEGILLGLALGGLGAGIVLWTRLIDSDPETEEREPLESSPEDEREPINLRPEGMTRRSLLVRLVFGAGGALAAALAIPTLSLGPRPGASLFRTGWRTGVRVVDEDGEPIRPLDLPLEGVLTVFPDGA